jgi:hypothetical protein
MGNRLIPESRMDHYKLPPQTLPRSPGHYQEWVNACRGDPAAGSNFVDHAALVTEVCLLGNIAVRSQQKLRWDGSRFRFTNEETANKSLHREYRQGWTW